VLVQAPKSDIFVVLLGIALGAIFIAMLLLVMVLNRYGFKTKATAMAPSTRVALLAYLEEPTVFSTVRL